MAVLGAVLQMPRLLDRVLGTLDPDDFYRPSSAAIFAAMSEMSRDGIGIDRVTLLSHLRKTGRFELVQGEACLIELESVPDRVANLEHYADSVRQSAERRRVIEASALVAQSARDWRQSIDEVHAAAETHLLALGAQQASPRFERAGAIMQRYLDAAAARAASGSAIIGIPSGFHAWDLMLSGLCPGRLNLIAARPGMGKTGWATTVAYNVASQGKTVAFFSLEMRSDEVIGRMAGTVAGIDSRVIALGRLTPEAARRVNEASAAVAQIPLYLCDHIPLSPAQMLAHCRALRASAGSLDLVIIDYVQITRPDAGTGRGSGDSRATELGEIAAGLKGLAKALDVPVVALSQLSRSVEKREDKRPMLADLAEAGGLEAAADSVTFLYRPDYYHRQGAGTPAPDAMTPSPCEVIVEKNRYGSLGTVVMGFTPALCRFDAMPEDRY